MQLLGYVKFSKCFAVCARNAYILVIHKIYFTTSHIRSLTFLFALCQSTQVGLSNQICVLFAQMGCMFVVFNILIY